MLTLKHDVRSSDYRNPMGPVPTETDVTIRFVAEGEDAALIRSARLFYAYGLDAFTKGHVLMAEASDAKGEGQRVFSCVCPMIDEPGLFFYWFEVRLTDKRYFWCFPDEKTLGLTGVALDHSLPFSIDGSAPIPGFQITVYARDFKTPDRMKGAVMYQIFPDRFRSGGVSAEVLDQAFAARPERIRHRSWDDDVDVEGRKPLGYQAHDFFCGSLEGIREMLPSLASAGVTALYLNPIFEAQSNHRYDAGDYLRVDPVLGDRASFKSLCEDAERLGIGVILDIAMSHTGADSRYFNRYGRYDTVGAFQTFSEGADSPYASWYRPLPADTKNAASVTVVDDSGEERAVAYDAWWGFPSLPNVNENDLTYSAFMLGKEGVLAGWLRDGGSGFRLDVSDELPDTYLRRLRKAVKREKKDAFILGEVWEEPTAKISYGHHRDFLFGKTHDAVMGYTFRRAALDFLSGKITADLFSLALQKMIALVPAEALYTQMNLIGSHDTCRAINELAGPPKPPSRREQQALFLTEGERRKGEALLSLAFLLQVAFLGVMANYYGDEIGMEGYDDPFNRRTYPETAHALLRALSSDPTPRENGAIASLSKLFSQAKAQIDEVSSRIPSLTLSPRQGKTGGYSFALLPVFRRLARLRKDVPVLRTGFFEITEAHDDLIVMRRFLDGNRCDAFGRHIPAPSPGEARIAINRGDRAQPLREKGPWPETVGPRDGFLLWIDG